MPRKVLASGLPVGPHPWCALVVLCLTLFGCGRMAWAAGEIRYERPSGFGVRLASGDFREYRLDADDATFVDEFLEATLKRVHNGEHWELEVTARQGIGEVWFPWDVDDAVVGATISDDVVLFPHQLGVVEKADAVKAGSWVKDIYPGRCFAPLVLFSDPAGARMIAATNWPPQILQVSYSRGRMALGYLAPLKAGERRKVCALVASAPSDRVKGIEGWQTLVDAYRSWLLPHLRDEGLYPIEYPDELRYAHGWLHISLHKLAHFDADELRREYQRWSDVFPWMQCWGQMSNYSRSPADGQVEWPDPPLKEGEKTGCCVQYPRLHERYAPGLPKLAREINEKGGTVGFYARPPAPYGRLDTNAGNAYSFLRSWVTQNQADGATAFYLDVVGARNFGEPLVVAKQLLNDFPRMVVIERSVDVYPSAFLVSGCLWGNRAWATEPGQTPEKLGGAKTRVTFPRFGRYLLNYQAVFLGFSNGDFMWWGSYRGHDHWTERQAFLLGAKLDVPTQFKGQRGWIEAVNPVVREIVAEWKRVDWWRRGPTYQDRTGIADLPDGIDVRRFEDQSGKSLFAVDNWQCKRGASFTFQGKRVAIPPRRISVVEMDSESDSNQH